MPRRPLAKRDKPATVRLTKTEYEDLKHEAEALNLTFSDYVRKILLKRPLPQVQSELSVLSYRELQRIGQNVNQLAMATNQSLKLNCCPNVSTEQWQQLHQMIRAIAVELAR